MSVISPDKLELTSDKPVGTGHTAAVYVAYLKGQLVAIKQFTRNGLEFNNEIALLKTIKHENIIKMLGYYKAPAKRYLVLEYSSDGTMSKYLSNNKPNNWAVLSRFHIQIIDGMQYLHNQKIVHSDLKYGNILLNKDKIKITDFGISRRVGGKSIERARSVLGTEYYMAPEVANGWRAVYESDVWSFGCMLYYTVTRHPPYEHIPFKELFRRLQLDEPVPLASLAGGGIPPNYLKIAEASLNWHLDKRPSFEAMKILLRTGAWRADVGRRTKVPLSVVLLRPVKGHRGKKRRTSKSGEQQKKNSSMYNRT